MSLGKFSLRIFILLLIFLLSGCAVKFMYNQLDWLIPWYVDDYVSLNSDQESQFNARLEEYLDWHRTRQLPVYADFLEWVAKASEDGLNGSELSKIQSDTEAFADQLYARLAPASLDLFSSLDDAQIKQLFKNLAEENAEYVDKYVNTDERKQRNQRSRESRKFLERWTGELNEAQIKLIDDWSGQYILMGEEFIESRLAWQNKLHRILMRRDERDFLEQSLMELFAHRRGERSAQYVEKFRKNTELFKQLEGKLDHSLTSLQRRHLIRKLNGYAQDFRELSGQKLKNIEVPAAQ